MKSALDVHRELLARDVPHEIVRLGTTILDADDLPRVLALPAERCVAIRCYLTDDRFTAVLVAAGAVPDPAALLEAAGACSLRPADAGEINAATDYAARLVSPVGLPDDVLLLADDTFGSGPQAGEQVLYAAVGEGGVALGIRTDDLLRVTGARPAALTVRPLPAAARAPWGDGDVVLDLDAPAPAVPPSDVPAPPRPPRR